MMKDYHFFAAASTIPVAILLLALFSSSADEPNNHGTLRPSSGNKHQRTKAEREALLAKAREPEPPDNPVIEPDHAIIGHWAPLLLDFSGQTLQLHADGTFDLWQHNCINIYDDYPIHGRYLFDGTEIQLGVEERLAQFVWTHAWSLWKYEGETFLVPKQVLHTLDVNDPQFPGCLQYRDEEWDDAKHVAFLNAFLNRHHETVPANACYPENVNIADERH